MRKVLLLLIPISIFLFSCQSDGREAGAEKSVEEVTSADIVRPQLDASKNKPAAENKPQVPADTVNVGKIEFAELVHDFGTIEQGENAEHVFKFKNTGKVPLVISNARGSCGCTVPKWPKEPIAVGETGEIEVKFNSSGKKGPQNKTVTLTANTWPTTTRVNIKGNVNAPDKPAEVANQKQPIKTVPANK